MDEALNATAVGCFEAEEYTWEKYSNTVLDYLGYHSPQFNA